MRRYSNPNVRAGNVLSIKTSTSAPPALARHVNCRELYIHKTWTQETGTHIIRLSVENVRHPTRGSILHEMTIQNDLNEPTVYRNCGQYHPIQSETILKIVRHATIDAYIQMAKVGGIQKPEVDVRRNLLMYF